jgi:hypothetical protein
MYRVVWSVLLPGHAGVGGSGGRFFVFNQQNPLLIAPVDPRLSQVVPSTPLDMPCSELQGYNAPQPGLRMPLRLRFCPQIGYTYRCLGAAASWARGFPVIPRYTPPGVAPTKLVW